MFHDSLTQEQSHKIENTQIVCLKVILQENYVNYSVALEMCSLDLLSSRRERRSLLFGLRAIKHPDNKRLFPLNPEPEYDIRNSEVFHVNFARTEAYKKSAIPSIQRRLNEHYNKNIL